MAKGCPVDYAEHEAWKEHMDYLESRVEENALSRDKTPQKLPKMISPSRGILNKIKARIEALNILKDGLSWGKIK